MTTFNNALHTIAFLVGDKLSSSERLHLSDAVLSSLVHVGVLGGKFEISATAPADTSKVWVDGGVVPAQVRTYDGATWGLADFDDIWALAGYVEKAGDTLTGALVVTDGSASAPSVAFGPTASTGWYRSGVDEVSFASGGTQVLSIGPSGLTVVGGSTIVESANMEIEDNQITLNRGEFGSGVSSGTAGIDIDRGALADALLQWNEAGDRWEAGVAGSMQTLITRAASAGGAADLVQDFSTDELVLRGLTAGLGLSLTQDANEITIAATAATEIAPGIVPLASNAATQAGTDNSRAVTPASLASLTATDTRRGLVGLATDAVALAMSSSSVAVTPANLLALLAGISTMGFTQLATVAQIAAGDFTGSTGAPLVMNPSQMRGTADLPIFTPTSDKLWGKDVSSGAIGWVDPVDTLVPATTGVRGGIIVAKQVEVLGAAVADKAVTPWSLMSAPVVGQILDRGWDQQADISAAELASLDWNEHLLIELDDGSLRQIRVDQLPRSTVTDNGTTITHNDGFGTTVTFREGRSTTTSNTAPASPEVGDKWWQPSDGVLYERIDDSGNEMWLETSGGGRR